MTKTAYKKVQYTKIIIKIVIHTYQLNNKNGQGETLESIQTIKHGFHRPFCIYMFKLYNNFYMPSFSLILAFVSSEQKAESSALRVVCQSCCSVTPILLRM